MTEDTTGAAEHRIATEKTKKRNRSIAIIASACACVIFVVILFAALMSNQGTKPNHGTKSNQGTKANQGTILDQRAFGKIRSAEVGDIVTFGTYEQDSGTSNSKEDIEWLVLAKENNRILVISDRHLIVNRIIQVGAM